MNPMNQQQQQQQQQFAMAYPTNNPTTLQQPSLSLAPTPAPAPIPAPLPSPSPALNESNISAALSFLQHGRVASSPLAKRLAFLESKGLSGEEIAEALKRNSMFEEQRLVLAGLSQGRKASEAVAAAEEAKTQGQAMMGQTGAYNTTQQPQQPAMTQPAYSSYPAQPLPASYSSPYPLPSYTHTQYAQPPPQQPAPRTWRNTFTELAAFAGLATSAALLANHFLRPADPPAEPPRAIEPPAQTPALLMPPEPASAEAPVTASPPLSLSLRERDRYGLSSLHDDVADPAVASGLQEIRQEIAALGEKMRDQSSDMRRMIESIKQTLDIIKEKDRQNEKTLSELNQIKSLLKDPSKPPLVQAASTDGSASSGPAPLVSAAPRSQSNGSLFSWNGAATTASSKSNSPRSVSSGASGGGNGGGGGSGSAGGSMVMENISDLYEDNSRTMRDSLNQMKCDNGEAECKMAVNTLLLYINNLQNNLTEARYRKILTTNANYATRIRQVKGAEAFLRSCGFDHRGSFCEWTGLEGEERRQEIVKKLLNDGQEMLKQFQSAIAALGSAAFAVSIPTPSSASAPASSSMAAPSSAVSSVAPGLMMPPALSAVPVAATEGAGNIPVAVATGPAADAAAVTPTPSNPSVSPSSAVSGQSPPTAAYPGQGADPAQGQQPQPQQPSQPMAQGQGQGLVYQQPPGQAGQFAAPNGSAPAYSSNPAMNAYYPNNGAPYQGGQPTSFYSPSPFPQAGSLATPGPVAPPSPQPSGVETPQPAGPSPFYSPMPSGSAWSSGPGGVMAANPNDQSATPGASMSYAASTPGSYYMHGNPALNASAHQLQTPYTSSALMTPGPAYPAGPHSAPVTPIPIPAGLSASAPPFTPATAAASDLGAAGNMAAIMAAAAQVNSPQSADSSQQ